MKEKKVRPKAVVNQKLCVACGACQKTCPKEAIKVYKGMYAVVNPDLCIGCTKCEKTCPASIIEMKLGE